MRLVSGHGRLLAKGMGNHESNGEGTWPLDARVALFMLESTCEQQADPACAPPRSRELERFSCRVQARLWRIDGGAIERVEVFIRDLSAAHAGFVTDRPLQVGASYVMDFAPRPGAPMRIACAVGRCRSFMDDGRWHEGVLHLDAQAGAMNDLALERVAV